MSVLAWVLAGLFAYTAAAFLADRRGLLPDSVSVSGPILTLHTGRGRVFLDRLARPKRFWRAIGNVGVGVALVVMVGTFALLLVQSISIIRSPPAASAIQSPRNVLVIPGVNEFLPLSVAPEIVAGLLLGMIVHEGGHGLFCRVEDIEITSMGVALLAVLPIGAFVQPDEESARAAARGPRARMYAAGVLNNLLLTVLAFALLFGPVAGAIAVAPGAPVGGVYPGGAAETAGLEAGDRIVAIDGEPIEAGTTLLDRLGDNPNDRVSVTLADGRERTLERSAQVTSLVATSPFASGETAGGLSVEESTSTTIIAVDDTAVTTEGDIRAAAAAADSDAVELTVRDDAGETRTVSGPLGVLATVSPDGGLAAAGAPEGEPIVVTEIEGQRIVTFGDLESALADRTPGERVEVVGHVGGEQQRYDVALQPNPEASDDVLVGVAGATGLSGIGVNSVGVESYPADYFLSILSGEVGGGLVATLLFLVLLPFVSAVDPNVAFNFAGFVDSNAAFYEVVGPLSALGEGGVFLLANVLFWTGWINFNLALFNCIPAFPLDGGHILRTATQSVVSRLPIEAKPALTRTVTTSVGLLMLTSLVLMLFGPQLLN